jgi:hypothetical protein
MKKKLVILFLVTALIVPTTIFAQDMEMNPDQPADPSLEENVQQQGEVVAEVNGEKITQEELAQQANINQLLQQVSQIDQSFVQLLVNSEEGNALLKEYQKQQLDSLINNVLLKQQVEEENITLSESEADEFYQQQKEAILQNNNMSEEEFKSALENQGYASESEYKNEIMENPQFKINKLIEEKVVSNIDVSEEELKAEYENNKENFQQQGEDVSFEDVKPRLEQMLVQQKQSQQIRQYLEDLRDDAEIEKNI